MDLQHRKMVNSSTKYYHLICISDRETSPAANTPDMMGPNIMAPNMLQYAPMMGPMGMTDPSMQTMMATMGFNQVCT